MGGGLPAGQGEVLAGCAVWEALRELTVQEHLWASLSVPVWSGRNVRDVSQGFGPRAGFGLWSHCAGGPYGWGLTGAGEALCLSWERYFQRGRLLNFPKPACAQAGYLAEPGCVWKQ